MAETEPNEIWERAADLVGEDVLEKLALHGLVVLDQACLDKFLDEHRKSNDRIRAAANAAMSRRSPEPVRT